MVDLSTKLKECNVSDLLQAIKFVNKLKDMKSIVCFPKLGNPHTDWKMVYFFGNLNEGVGNTEAHVLWIKDRKGNCCPVAWLTNKINRVVRSTVAANTLSLQEGLESAAFNKKLQ